MKFKGKTVSEEDRKAYTNIHIYIHLYLSSIYTPSIYL